MPRFAIFDPYLAATFTPTIGPSEGGQPARKRQITMTPTAAADGVTIASEGARPPLEFSWKATILTIAQRDLWITWTGKPYQVRVTDDLGEQYWVLFDSFDPGTRKNVVLHEIRLDASIHGYELDVP